MHRNDAHRTGRVSSTADRTIKPFGAVLLLVALGMPLSTCSYRADEQGRNLLTVPKEKWPAETHEVVTYRYPLEEVSWLPLAYVWPMLAVVVLRRRPAGKVAVTVRVLEAVLIPASVGVIDFTASFLATRAVGAYWAYGAYAVYGIGAIWSDAVALRGWRAARRRGSRSVE